MADDPRSLDIQRRLARTVAATRAAMIMQQELDRIGNEMVETTVIHTITVDTRRHVMYNVVVYFDGVSTSHSYDVQLLMDLRDDAMSTLRARARVLMDTVRRKWKEKA